MNDMKFIQLTHGNLILSINEKDKTASVIGITGICQRIFIPRSVLYNQEDFIITRLSEGTFANTLGIHTILFPPDSELGIIESNSLSLSSLISLTIPSSVYELQDGWCKNLRSLRYVTIMPNNQYYKNIGNLVVGKSDIRSDEYDILVFVNRDVETITIPQNIKILASYSFSFSIIKNIFIPSNVIRINEGCFSSCSELQNIEFSPNSELQTIERNAFEYTSIDHIIIPSSVCELKKGWCGDRFCLKRVTIMPNNQYYKNIGNLVVGKSDIRSDEYDVLVFVNRDVETITIPQNIKILASYSFSSSIIKDIFIPSNVTRINEGCFLFCSKLQNIEFSPNSELKIIECKAFSNTSINNISIPPHVNQISESAFFFCNNLNKIEIPVNSELQVIEKNAFAFSAIENLLIPSQVSELKDGWCSSTIHLNQISVMPNNKNYIKFNDNLIIGKSDVNSEEYDTLVFANRDLKAVKIPSFIKIISAHAFSYSLLETIFIPSQVKFICESAFSFCGKLNYVEISSNSELQVIEKKAFHNTIFKSIVIPSQVKHIEDDCFLLGKLEIIEIGEISILQLFDTSIFNDLIIFSPIK